MEQINRYVYAVVSKLPEKGRKEIEQEIRGLIDDMMEEYGDAYSEEEKINEALKQLGDPAIFVENYRGKKRYLIGPSYFSKYLLVLKIVLGAIFIGITVGTAVDVFVHPEMKPQDGMFNVVTTFSTVFATYVSALMGGLLQGAAWVTLIFAIIEYNSVDIKISDEQEKSWDPSSLVAIPHKKTTIKPVEAIIGIVFTTIFFILFYFVPQYIAAFVVVNGERVIIPVFHVEALSSMKYLIIALFAVGISKGLLKLVWGRWTRKAAVLYSAISLLSAGLLSSFFLNSHIWNRNFMSELAKVPNGDLDMTQFPQWEQFATGIVVIIVFFTLLDIVLVNYKAIKYGEK